MFHLPVANQKALTKRQRMKSQREVNVTKISFFTKVVCVVNVTFLRFLKAGRRDPPFPHSSLPQFPYLKINFVRD